MNKKIRDTIILIVLSFFIVLPELYNVLAADNTIPNPISSDTIGEIITKASSLIAPFAVLGFTGCIIYAGYIRMFAAGNPEKEAKSMKIAIAAAIGFAIIALAPVIMTIIANLIGVKDEYTTDSGGGPPPPGPR